MAHRNFLGPLGSHTNFFKLYPSKVTTFKLGVEHFFVTVMLHAFSLKKRS